MALRHIQAFAVLALLGAGSLAASRSDISDTTEQIAQAVDGVIVPCPTTLKLMTAQCIRADLDSTSVRHRINSSFAGQLSGAWRGGEDTDVVYNYVFTPSGAVFVAAGSTDYGQSFLLVDGLETVATSKVTVTPRLARSLKLTTPRMYGADIRALQNRLMDVSHTARGKGGDGWFGPITQANVIAFQTANRLPVTGVVDQSTWKLLFSSGAQGYDSSIIQQLAKQLKK